jgi:hypothetical protein
MPEFQAVDSSVVRRAHGGNSNLANDPPYLETANALRRSQDLPSGGSMCLDPRIGFTVVVDIHARNKHLRFRSRWSIGQASRACSLALVGDEWGHGCDLVMWPLPRDQRRVVLGRMADCEVDHRRTAVRMQIAQAMTLSPSSSRRLRSAVETLSFHGAPVILGFLVIGFLAWKKPFL